MTLQDIFDQLTYGELSQIFTGEGGLDNDGIPSSKRKEVIAHITLGLTALHKRFLLREGTLSIGLVEGRQSYVINKKYAASNTESLEAVKYILDTADPYMGNLLKIERVYAEDGTELTLNMIDDPESIRTPTYNSLLVPATVNDKALTGNLKVVYRADHPTLDPVLAKAVPFQTEIEIGPSHLECLLLYVASRVHTPIGMSGEFHDGNNYAAKYERSCQQLEAMNYRVDTAGVNNRLERNGWV